MNKDFLRRVVKGKIVELLFNEMFQEADEFTVIPMGYENTMPDLAQHKHHLQVKKVIENIRSAPDFVLINKDKTQVFLVEVKYRHVLDPEDLKKKSEEILKRWDPSFLFVATPDKFYMSSCHKLLNNLGNIEELNESWVNKDIQNKYLEVMMELYKKIFLLLS